MEIKIVSDGTLKGTKVINKETGEEIKGVKSILWSIGVDTTAIVELTLVGKSVELIGDVRKKGDANKDG